MLDEDGDDDNELFLLTHYLSVTMQPLFGLSRENLRWFSVFLAKEPLLSLVFGVRSLLQYTKRNRLAFQRNDHVH